MKRTIPILFLLVVLLSACQTVNLSTPQPGLQINNTAFSIGAVEGSEDQQQLSVAKAITADIKT